ncbi:MAG: cytochrome c biogenesis protein CcsA [Cytophagales bacterium]|nr:cytochrome c biogenesis protein CcsA [Cytophagales bacterium]
MNISYLWGDLGHLLTISTFVSAAALSYLSFVSTKNSRTLYALFSIHGISLIGTWICLYILLFQQRYDYYYVWSHMSNWLSLPYQISCLWEGQEGSFMLWMLFQAILAGICLWKKKYLKLRTLSILMAIQTLLGSMILGVYFGDIAIGSSPFQLTRHMLNIPIFQTEPHFIPTDGKGLNLLLQNYWMIIHPPVLFFGFALTGVPFAITLATLYQKNFGKYYQEFLESIRKWTLLTISILGIGIMMGAYWAYETLNFGGYWSWDPVENAVYIPWILTLAQLHMIRLSKDKKHYLRYALTLPILSFSLVWYATFLIRSGILGDSSVHAFTDAGLSGQLLSALILFISIPLLYLLKAWKYLPKANYTQKNSLEMGMLIGISLFLLMAFQVLVPTSIPVFNSLIQMLSGYSPQWAPPIDAINFYADFQIWFAIGIAILSAIVPFWVPHLQALRKSISWFIFLVLGIASLCLLVFPLADIRHILLLSSSLFSVLAQISYLFYTWKKIGFNSSSAAGLSHLGIAMMLIGILLSAQDQNLSTNYTGKIWNSNFPDEINTDNMLLFQNEPRKMLGFQLVYQGIYKKTEIGFQPAHLLQATHNPTHWIRLDSVQKIPRKDTLKIPEAHKNYFKIQYQRPNKSEISLWPQVQYQEDRIVYSPHIAKYWNKDIYTHVRTFSDPQKIKWTPETEKWIKPQDSLLVKDYTIQFQTVEPVPPEILADYPPNTMALQARLLVKDKEHSYFVQPKIFVKGKELGFLPGTIPELGIRLTLIQIRPETEDFLFRVERTQKPWIIIEMIEKPFIHLIWIGACLSALGMFCALLNPSTSLLHAKKF